VIKINKVLITGGAGFIGYFISKALSESTDNEIFIVDNLSKAKADDEFLSLIKRSNVSFLELDLSDLKSYSNLEQEYDQIYHLAAIVGVKKVMKNPVLTLRVNTLSTIYLLDYIKKMNNKPKLLFASSCENYAGSIKHCAVKIPTSEDVPLCIEDIYNPRWTYAGSKILGEIACIQYSKQYNFATTIARYHNAFGPRMGTQHVIPEFILRLKSNLSKMDMFGGYQYRSFCYVEDAARMTINLMDNSAADNKIVNIGSDNYIQISSLAKKLCDIKETYFKLEEKGAPKGSIEKRKPDLNLIKKLGDYVSDFSFDEGLKRTYEWYKKVYQ
jgi:nucleoside-diphosphate-sugar epimerase